MGTTFAYSNRRQRSHGWKPGDTDSFHMAKQCKKVTNHHFSNCPFHCCSDIALNYEPIFSVLSKNFLEHVWESFVYLFVLLFKFHALFENREFLIKTKTQTAVTNIFNKSIVWSSVCSDIDSQKHAYVCRIIFQLMSSKKFQPMRLFVMFVTGVCVLFLIKLRWPKKKSIVYDNELCFTRKRWHPI